MVGVLKRPQKGQLQELATEEVPRAPTVGQLAEYSRQQPYVPVPWQAKLLLVRQTVAVHP